MVAAIELSPQALDFIVLREDFGALRRADSRGRISSKAARDRGSWVFIFVIEKAGFLELELEGHDGAAGIGSGSGAEIEGGVSTRYDGEQAVQQELGKLVFQRDELRERLRKRVLSTLSDEQRRRIDASR